MSVLRQSVNISDFHFIENEEKRKGMLLMANATASLPFAKDAGGKELYALEAEVRDKFIELGIPRKLYDSAMWWNRNFWDALKEVAARESVGATVRTDDS